jgi:hypothetical protein
MAEENQEVKRTSKLSSLIASENEGMNGLQVSVYYSENNWETCEEINLILDENTTINQLIDSSIYKFKTELFFDNIDKKQFNVRLFKKKKKVPNDEYPICNPESKVKDYGKIHFCLVEDINAENEEKKEEEKPEKKPENKSSGDNTKEKETDLNINNENGGKEKKDEQTSQNYKTCKDRCFACGIF